MIRSPFFAGCLDKHVDVLGRTHVAVESNRLSADENVLDPFLAEARKQPEQRIGDHGRLILRAASSMRDSSCCIIASCVARVTPWGLGGLAARSQASSRRARRQALHGSVSNSDRFSEPMIRMQSIYEKRDAELCFDLPRTKALSGASAPIGALQAAAKQGS